MTGVVPEGAATTAAGRPSADGETAMASAFATLLGEAQGDAEPAQKPDTPAIEGERALADMVVAAPMLPLVSAQPQPLGLSLDVASEAPAADADASDFAALTNLASATAAPVVGGATQVVPEAAEDADAALTNSAPKFEPSVPVAPVLAMDAVAPAPLPAPAAAMDSSQPHAATLADTQPAPALPADISAVPDSAPSDEAAQTPDPDLARAAVERLAADRDVASTPVRQPSAHASAPPMTQGFVVPPAQAEPVRKYSAEGRMVLEEADLSGTAASGHVTEPSVADLAAEPAPPAAAPTKDTAAKAAFETALAATATAPANDGEVMEADAPTLDPAAPETRATEDARVSLLSQATLRTTAELAAAMIHRLGQRSTRFDMVLTPESLGNVEVSIEVGSDGQMSARLAFDNPQASQELRARADELRRQLAEAGFTVSENALEFTDRESDPRGGFHQHLSDGRSGRRAFIGAARLAQLADAPVVPVWTPLSPARTGVDMKV